MIKVNFRSGHTASYDLEAEQDRELWRQIVNDPLRAEQITAMAIHMHGILLTLPRPRMPHLFGADLMTVKNGEAVSGERIFYDVSGSRVEVVCYKDQKLVRVDQVKNSIRRFHPGNVLDRNR